MKNISLQWGRRSVMRCSNMFELPLLQFQRNFAYGEIFRPYRDQHEKYVMQAAVNSIPYDLIDVWLERDFILEQEKKKNQDIPLVTNTVTTSDHILSALMRMSLDTERLQYFDPFMKDSILQLIDDNIQFLSPLECAISLKLLNRLSFLPLLSSHTVGALIQGCYPVVKVYSKTLKRGFHSSKSLAISSLIALEFLTLLPLSQQVSSLDQIIHIMRRGIGELTLLQKSRFCFHLSQFNKKNRLEDKSGVHGIIERALSELEDDIVSSKYLLSPNLQDENISPISVLAPASTSTETRKKTSKKQKEEVLPQEIQAWNEEILSLLSLSLLSHRSPKDSFIQQFQDAVEANRLELSPTALSTIANAMSKSHFLPEARRLQNKEKKDKKTGGNNRDFDTWNVHECHFLPTWEIIGDEMSRLIKRDYAPPSIDKFLSKTRSRSPKVQSQSVAVLLTAFSSVRILHQDLVNAIIKFLPEIVEQGEKQSLVMLLGAFTHLGKANDHSLQFIWAKIETLISGLEWKEIEALTIALTKTSLSRPLLWDKLRERILFLLGSKKPSEESIVSLSYALVKGGLAGSSIPILLSFANHLRESDRLLPIVSFANACDAYSELLQVTNAEEKEEVRGFFLKWEKVILESNSEELNNIPPALVVKIICGYSAAQTPLATRLTTKLLKRNILHMKKLTFLPLSKLLNACHSLGVVDDDILALLQEYQRKAKQSNKLYGTVL